MSVVGVHFKPGGAFPFLGVPAGELRNAQVPLDALWGRQARELTEQILGATTMAARFRVLEQSLLAKAGGQLDRHRAVDFALKALVPGPAAPTIAEVTNQIGLSARQFIQIFADQVGLTPKLYCRVRRFQKALTLIGKVQKVEWASVAYTCGYYDQAHFIGEFRDFSGLTPTEYLRIRGEHLNHVPLAD
jgi:AraC-like DNA-binding protein